MKFIEGDSREHQIANRTPAMQEGSLFNHSLWGVGYLTQAPRGVIVTLCNRTDAMFQAVSLAIPGEEEEPESVFRPESEADRRLREAIMSEDSFKLSQVVGVLLEEGKFGSSSAGD